MTHVSLFTGIGGIDLAAEWAGFTTIAQVEKDPYCRRVLERHWPDVHRVVDIKDFPDRDYGTVTLVSGGFPCQDISHAGKGLGLVGKRSGLWFEFARILRLLRPQWALLENVGALSFRGLTDVLGSLTEIGYDAEWETLCASDIGAPHERKRMFIVAYPNEMGRKVCDKSFAGRSLSWDRLEIDSCFQQATDTSFLRTYDGIPGKLDKNRIAALGNAVVPQQAYPILKAIAEVECA